MGLSHETLDRWQEYADEDVLDLIEVDDMNEAIRVLRALLAPVVKCAALSVRGNHTCALEPGHAGAHMRTLRDGTTHVWMSL